MVSLFASALRNLLDDARLYSRSSWAEILDVSEAAVSQWVNDKTLPRPETLRSIRRIAGESDGVDKGILNTFDQVVSLPALEASPVAKRLNGSLAHYMLTPLIEGFLRSLRSLSAEAQEEVLYSAAEDCRRRAGHPAPPAAPVMIPEAKHVVPEISSEQTRAYDVWSKMVSVRSPDHEQISYRVATPSISMRLGETSSARHWLPWLRSYGLERVRVADAYLAILGQGGRRDASLRVASVSQITERLSWPIPLLQGWKRGRSEGTAVLSSEIFAAVKCALGLQSKRDNPENRICIILFVDESELQPPNTSNDIPSKVCPPIDNPQTQPWLKGFESRPRYGGPTGEAPNAIFGTFCDVHECRDRLNQVQNFQFGP